MTVSNEIRQPRMGLGQVFDYASTLQHDGRTVCPILYMEQQPANQWCIELTRTAGVKLVWPGTEHRIGLYDHRNEPVDT